MASAAIGLGAVAVVLLLAAAGVARFASPAGPGVAPWLVRAGCAVGLVAAALPGTETWSHIALAALFLFGLADARADWRGPLVLAAAATAIGAGHAWAAAAALGLAAWVSRPAVRLHRAWFIPALGVLIAGFGLGGVEPGFATLRGAAPHVPPVLLLGTLLATAALPVVVPGPGGLLAVWLTGSFLLDLPGPPAPGWWAGPVIAIGVAAAVLHGRRAAAAATLDAAGTDAMGAAHGLALAALGTALLARGADLLPAASLSVAGAGSLLIGTACWGGTVAIAAACLRGQVGGTELARLGGLLNRAPVLALGLGVGLLGLAGVPVGAGFASLWLVAQGVAGSTRAGGLGGLALLAGVMAALGLVVALLLATATRLVGTVLLGTPRTAKAAALAEPGRPTSAALLGFALLTTLCGLLPGVPLAAMQPGIRQLARAGAEGVGWLFLGGDALAYGPSSAPTYAPALLGAVLLAFAAVLARCLPRGGGEVPAWQGGFAEGAIGRANTAPLHLRPPASLPSAGRLAIAVLALLGAAALGWAAR